MAESASSTKTGARLAGEVSGAFADLGTFLPLALGVLAVGSGTPGGVLTGFGLFALAVALIYRRPLPVQPMKAVAALAIVGGLTAAQMAASGLLIGLALVALAAFGLIEKLARFLPQSVLAGIQLGLGGILVLLGLDLALQEPWVGGLALAALLLLQLTPLRGFSCLLVLGGALAWSLLGAGRTLPELTPSLTLPALALPAIADFRAAAEGVFLPQLALTLTNAVLLTAVVAGELFPQDRARIASRRLAFSSGALNLLLAPFGALPMCHGAGGLVAQHRFGARSGLAPAIFGTLCLILGLFYAADALALLGLLPLAAVGALLAYAGAEFALSKRLFDGRPSCLVVILLTAAVCIAVNVAVGLIVGLIAEWLRGWLLRRWFARKESRSET
ncbi:MAG: putative sulfate/molybdate transporter [Rhodovibrionaceae bacterium]